MGIRKLMSIEYFKIINTKIYLKPIENPNKTPSNYTSIHHSKFKKQQEILNNRKQLKLLNILSEIISLKYIKKLLSYRYGGKNYEHDFKKSFFW